MERILDFKIIFVLGFIKYDPWYFSCPTFNDTSFNARLLNIECWE